MLTNEAKNLNLQEFLFPVSRMVLLVEDDAPLREQLADEIRSDGFEVIELDDGLQLLDYFVGITLSGLRRLPDAIVAETSLPGYSGLEVCGRLRELGIEVPFILLTPSRVTAVYAEADRVGAAFIFDKPLDIDNLRNAVSSVAGGW